MSLIYNGHYIVPNDKLEALFEIYEGCQSWDDNNTMLTGTTYDEIDDFVVNSPCIAEIFVNM